MAVLWLLILWDNKSEIYRPKIKNNYPKTAIVVPCFNEEKTIAKTLRSLVKLDYPKDKLEIIVVDDGSKDNTYEKAKAFERYDFVKVLRKENGGKHSALNLGIKATKAEFVGCVDADSFVASSALKLMLPYFSENNVMAVAASLKVDNPKNMLQQIQRIEYLLGILMRKVLSLVDSIFVLPGPFTIFRRKVFDEIGLFKKAHNTEDLEITLRIQAKHYKIATAFNACVYTVTPSSLRQLYSQRVRWYQGLLRNAWDYRRLVMNRKYGDFGLFIFPIVFASIPIFVGAVFHILYQLTSFIIVKIALWQSIGFDFGLAPLNFDLFFINTKSLFFIGGILLLIGIAVVVLAKKFSFEQNGIAKGFFFFAVFFKFLYFIWWLGALHAVIFRKENKWQK